MTSQGYRVFTGGQWVDFGGGTSTGSPIWGAITAIINQARRAVGRSRVGFINPALYRLAESHPEVFREITEGSTDVAMKAVDIHGRAVTYELGGYHAVSGWDPVSGLGVPRVAKLVEAFTTDPEDDDDNGGRPED